MTADDPPWDGKTSPRRSGDPVRHQWGDGVSPSTAVVEAVAAVTDCEPLELPLFSDHVDLEALDALVTAGGSGSDGRIRVSFAYDDLRVRVSSDGEIEIS
ncbi:MAG: HalOD1 output domain-containing protein [Haloferacaceae archaeon]